MNFTAWEPKMHSTALHFKISKYAKRLISISICY